ncbi:MAG: tyrosine-type recombinase/integrase [Metamycoplasmataceae bacterium]
MKYESYLKNKNLSKNTLKAYLRIEKKWNEYLMDQNPTIKKVINFLNIKDNSKIKASTIRLTYSSLISLFRFQKRWKLINEVREIKLPKEVFYNKEVITFDEYREVEKKINNISWFQKRNWLIFSILLMSGIRNNEILSISKKEIIDGKIQIKGKGNKSRIIFFNNYLLFLLEDWKRNEIAVNKKNRKLCSKQINSIVKTISVKYFNKELTPHSLRRSFATNLIRKKIDIKTVSILLGHSNINTTSRYIHLTNDEISNSIKNLY